MGVKNQQAKPEKLVLATVDALEARLGAHGHTRGHMAHAQGLPGCVRA